jgi:hypothetical protein
MVCLLRGQELVSHQIQNELLPRGNAHGKQQIQSDKYIP